MLRLNSFTFRKGATTPNLLLFDNRSSRISYDSGSTLSRPSNTTSRPSSGDDVNVPPELTAEVVCTVVEQALKEEELPLRLIVEALEKHPPRLPEQLPDTAEDWEMQVSLPLYNIARQGSALARMLVDEEHGVRSLVAMLEKVLQRVCDIGKVRLFVAVATFEETVLNQCRIVWTFVLAAKMLLKDRIVPYKYKLEIIQMMRDVFPARIWAEYASNELLQQVGDIDELAVECSKFEEEMVNNFGKGWLEQKRAILQRTCAGSSDNAEGCRPQSLSATSPETIRKSNIGVVKSRSSVSKKKACRTSQPLSQKHPESSALSASHTSTDEKNTVVGNCDVDTTSEGGILSLESSIEAPAQEVTKHTKKVKKRSSALRNKTSETGTNSPIKSVGENSIDE